MRALFLCALMGGVVGVAFVGCNPNSIGRPCVNPQGSDVRGTQISDPALECPSRLCLIQPVSTTGGAVADGGVTVPRATCTAPCQNNGDCEAETKSQCAGGFVCAVAATAGPFCCRKVCVCRADLQANVNEDPVDGGVILPHACDPETWKMSGMAPTCPNVKVK